MNRLYALIFLLVISFSVKSQDYTQAVEYMKAINVQHENISKKFMAYTSASAHGKKARKVEHLRTKLLNEVDQARDFISGMPPFKGERAYKDSSVNFMKLYYNVLNEDYSKIINLEDVAEQSYDAMEAYMLAKELVDKKLDEANEKIRMVEHEFAAKNNITLTEGQSELGDMMKKVSEVNKYYKVVYLIFFKSFKDEAYIIDAMGKANLTAIEQNKNALQKHAQEGLKLLESVKAFDGDNSLVTACKAMQNFYIMEVNDKIAIQTEYFLTKERFEKMKKEFEKKSSPTKEEVESYNKNIAEINKASNNYNTTNQFLNNKRNEVLNDWNNAVNAFFDTHTPHYK